MIILFIDRILMKKKVHFVVKTHKKGQYPFTQVCKFIAFFLEREYRFNMTDPVVLVLDMYEAGYSNMVIITTTSVANFCS